MAYYSPDSIYLKHLQVVICKCLSNLKIFANERYWITLLHSSIKQNTDILLWMMFWSVKKDDKNWFYIYLIGHYDDNELLIFYTFIYYIYLQSETI